jgi:replicative DNA helicase
MTAEPIWDETAEQALLGAVLMSGTALDVCLDMVTASSFYRPAHGTIWSCVVEMDRDEHPVDVITVCAELGRRGELLRVGGGPYLHSLIHNAPTALNAKYYADIVAEKAILRRVVQAGLRITQLAESGAAGANVSEVLDYVRREVQEATEGSTTLGNPQWPAKMLTGGSFIHDATDHVPAVWGRGDEVLWAEGEPLIITGPTGVGKTTLGAQVLYGRLGLQRGVLGYPVAPGRRVLYLAMDRPQQIRRALARLLRNAPRDVLDERLVVWNGPPPADLARNPRLLLELCQAADADTVILDSLKDAAVKLSDEETGQGLNTAMQHCVANGIEVLAYHHQRKSGGNGGLNKPNSLSDVYGSNWITAGCGSVVLLWGAAGDPVVELIHLKQPAEIIGPLKLIHDHTTGTTEIFHEDDVLTILLSGPRSAREVAVSLYGDDPSDSQVEKARRKLEKLANTGHATRISDPASGGAGRSGKGGGSGAKYAAAAREGDPTDRSTAGPRPLGAVHGRSTLEDVSAGQTVHAENSAGSVHGSVHALHGSSVSAGRSVHGSVHASNAPSVHVSPPSFREGERGRDHEENDGWVLAQLTHKPQPVGAIAEQAETDPFVVQASLDRLLAEGRITGHESNGHGPRTWSLPERDLDVWPTIPANQE